jgi:uncharacterized protein YjbI with pentapeptide repeats
MTTPNTTAKKVVDVEILHLDETGYGYEGKHTRREWRAECLEYFEKGAEAFLAWQESWQALAEQNEFEASFDVLRTFEDGSQDEVSPSGKRHSIDFLGHIFEDDIDAHGYQFLNEAIFVSTTFKNYANFSNAIFKGNAQFDETIFMGSADFRAAKFKSHAGFYNITFEGQAAFEKTIFKGKTIFRDATFADIAIFRKATFKGWTVFSGARFGKEDGSYNPASFDEAKFKYDMEFVGVHFNDHVSFNRATFSGVTHFRAIICTKGASFHKTIFNSYTNFSGTSSKDARFHTIFIGAADFNQATFTGGVNFNAVRFEKLANFFRVKFNNQSLFQSAFFWGDANFENATFANVGHFEGAEFREENSKIPSFRGVDLGGTSSLEFSDDTYFTKADFDDEAIKNIAFLKHLSEQHGQIDQALNFNAMELRAKYLQVVEPLRAQDLHLLERLFKRYFSGAWWAMRPTWLYGLLSDFGRSYMRPLLAYIAVFVFTFIFMLGFEIYFATEHKPQNCQYTHEGLSLECKAKLEGILPLDGYDAAWGYAMYHATGLVDFTGDSKMKEAITLRLYGKPVKSKCAQLFGALLSIINTALLFLIALGLRNSYRLK